MRDMEHKGRAAEDRRVDKGWRDAEILGERQARSPALRGRTDKAVDIAQTEPTIGERAVNALRHQIDRTHLLCDGAEIGFRDADDRGRAALQPVHHAPSAGTNTG